MGYCCDICKKEVMGEEDSATIWIGVIDGIVENVRDKGITQRELDTIKSRLVCDDCIGEEVSRTSISGTRQFRVRDYFINLLKNTGFIKREREECNPYKENRIGVFSVHMEVIVDNLDVSCLFKNMIIIRADQTINLNTIEYTAYSYMFDKVDTGVMAPQYVLGIMMEKGNKILTVRRLDNNKQKKSYAEKRIDAITGGVDLSTGARFKI